MAGSRSAEADQAVTAHVDRTARLSQRWGPAMTELERVERDIATLQGSIRIARRALTDPSLPTDDRDRWQASIDLYERHLCELLAARDDLRSLAED